MLEVALVKAAVVKCGTGNKITWTESNIVNEATE